MTKRIQRVNQLIKKELSWLILKEVELPKDVLLTITRVETTSNLTESNVYISVFPEREAKIIELLRKRIYFLQGRLNTRLKMRPLPKLNFILEKKTVEAGKIEEILERLKK